MNILITGVTETHLNYMNRASSTKFVSIPELMREAFTKMGHYVDHRKVIPSDNLRQYHKVFLFVYPLDNNVADTEGAKLVLDQRHDTYICLDDWSFQRVLPTWSDIIDAKDLLEHKWIVPLFPWGDKAKMGIDAELLSWDPSPLYEQPPCHKLSWKQRQKAWYNASLSTAAHEWATAQKLTWPVHAIGGKALGQKRMFESDIVWEYGSYKGVLCPTYAHAGCGWWRIRYLHAAHAGCVLGGSKEELGMIGPGYNYSLYELEDMTDEELEHVASQQAQSLVTATLEATQKRLQAFLS
jgi:hypothetical protein